MPATGPRLLADETWRSLPQRPTVLVPVGSLEQHGPHLPLDTDAAIATAVAETAAAELDVPDVIVAPTLVYAASGEHQAFPGTASIGAEALHQLLVELVRSLHAWAGRVVFVNAHGGNTATLTGAVTQLRSEGHDVCWVACVTDQSDQSDLHAGFVETSLMLHLRPAAVRLELAEPGNTAPLRQLMPAMLAGGVAAVSPNGVLGDPASATAADGARILREMTGRLVAELTAEAVS